MNLLSALHRVRSHAGHFLLLAVLALVATLVVTGVPRVADRLSQQGLREKIAEQPGALRDLTYATPSGGPPSPQPPRMQPARLDALLAGMPPRVRQVIDERWHVAQADFGKLTGPELAARKLRVDLGLRAATGIREAATLTEGRWPADELVRDAPIQVALAAGVADRLGLRAGSRLRLALVGPNREELLPTAVEVVGVYRPNEPTGGIWDSLPPALRLAEPRNDGDPFLAVGLTSTAALDARSAAGWPVAQSWRYRLDPRQLELAELDPLIADLASLGRSVPAPLTLTQGVDIALREFAASLTSARTVLTVIAAGVLAALAGLTGLAARLAVRRRQDEFALLRARGGTAGTLTRRGLAEALLVIPAAGALGWLLGSLLPGPPAVGGGATTVSGGGWYAVAVVLLATAVLPVTALAGQLAGHRQPAGGGGGRADLGRRRRLGGRSTAEVTVLLLAVVGAILLRRRGLPADGRLDLLLVSVPVLLAIGAAVLALRAYPWPLRLVSRFAARARGSVLFLGAARAAREPATAPLLVVVVAIATAAFCGVVAVAIEDGRDRAAEQIVPADALVSGERFAPDTAGELANLPGVDSVAPLLHDRTERVFVDRVGTPAGLDEVSVLLVDPVAFDRVLRRSGIDATLPAALNADGPAEGPIPAVVSPALAADLTDAGLDRTAFVGLRGGRYAIRVAETVESFPTLDRSVGRFVVLPWRALPAPGTTGAGLSVPGPTTLAPTGFLISGGRLDESALRQVADAGQERYQRTGVVTGGVRPTGAQVLTRDTVRDRIGGSGVNGLLVFGFAAGAGGGALLGLLAIAFAVLAGARGRAEVLSRLRTLGLSRRQWRGLLLVELTPLVGVALLTAAVVGVLLPLLLTPALGLAAFTDGAPVRVRFEPGLVGGIVALGAVALAVAVAVETLNNRRMRLGEVLRLDGGESK